MLTPIQLAMFRDKFTSAREYYNQAIAVTFIATGSDCQVKSLNLIAKVVKQDPRSARYRYAFAIMHKPCELVGTVDETAIKLGKELGVSSTTNQFFRRVVAKSYQRQGNITAALDAFEPELEIGLWHPRFHNCLIFSEIFGLKQTFTT